VNVIHPHRAAVEREIGPEGEPAAREITDAGVSPTDTFSETGDYSGAAGVALCAATIRFVPIQFLRKVRHRFGG